MNNNHFSITSLLLLLNILLASAAAPRKEASAAAPRTEASAAAPRKVYIVYLGEHSGEKTIQDIEDDHHSYLQYVKGSKEEAKASIIYSYKHVINGFSALLTPQEAAAISEMDGVISVFESQERRVHTTRSWDFISLLEANFDPTQANGEALLRRANYGKDVIVGVLDTGVWPESQSFNDQGMDPVPTSWKGICQSGVAFNPSNCNRKLIGARYYLRNYESIYGRVQLPVDYRSPRDSFGHGTHTASTIGGRRVPNAAAFGGFGNGTATGGAPLVRLAIYKVCWNIPGMPPSENNTCYDGDIMSAFDDAIADGVHVISVSLGSNTSIPYADDGSAIGSLHAVKRNIVVSFSAGNSGPIPSTVTNIAPWVITVGASSIDRVFPSPVVLGNGVVIEGQSITPFERRTYPLVYASQVEIPGRTTSRTTGQCYNGTLSPPLVRGKAVFCWSGDVYEALEVQRAGGVAAVLGNLRDGIGVQGSPYLIPGTVILRNDTDRMYNYIVSNRAPTVTLPPATTIVGAKPAPFMAPFSSIGPNNVEPNILKPDVTAPGLNILAAWSEGSSPLTIPQDHRVVKYNMDSGTSMSCPHVSAVAALLKAIHPNWSSAAIRSAIMTTAKQTNNLGNPITDALLNPATPFEYGSGHIQPSKAADPGLVYDASYNDYRLFLCRSIGNSLDPSFPCPPVAPSPNALNYPSLSIANLSGTMTVTRNVTNVGAATSSYSVTINEPSGFSVRISPTRLNFIVIGQTLSFTITVQAQSTARRNEFVFGWYTWSDGVHQVRSPIAVSAA